MASVQQQALLKRYNDSFARNHYRHYVTCGYVLQGAILEMAEVQDSQPAGSSGLGQTKRLMRWSIALGAALGATDLLAGAFGAHALKRMLEPGQLSTWDTAAEYQLAHAIALVLVGALGVQHPDPGGQAQASLRWLYVSAGCLFAGTVIFSGSLHAWVLSGTRIFALLPPVGGILLVAGWLALFAWALVAARR